MRPNPVELRVVKAKAEIPERDTTRLGDEATEPAAYSRKTRLRFMEPGHRKTLTFGELIAYVYSTCGRRDARILLRFAVNQRVVLFQGRQRFVVS